MTRFLSNKLDLRVLLSNPPALILELDFEAILARRLESLAARFEDAEIDVDVLGLETDPLVYLQQEDAYRQLLDYGLLNDCLRGLLPAFSTGTDLDHIVARSGVLRLQVGTDDNGNPVMEDDETLRMRYFASFGAPAAGSEDAYIFAALTAYPQAWHIYCTGPSEHGEPGRVDVVVTAPDGETVPEPTLMAIERACNAKTVRPLTDMTNIVGATPLPYVVTMNVQVLPGPDPVALRTEVVRNLQRITAGRYRGGGEVPISALKSAGFEAGAVDVVVSSPVADIPRVADVAPYCTAINVTVTERLND